MKQYRITILFFCLIFSVGSVAQVGIKDDNSNAVPSSILEVKSTEKGFLPPRMNTQQRNAIASPATGLIIFNTDCNDIQVFNGSGWVPAGNSGFPGTPGPISGNASPCINASGQTYSVSQVQGATGYFWTVPPGAIVTSGQGTASITVSFGTGTGYVTVLAYNDCLRSALARLQVNFQTAVSSPVAGTHVVAQTQITWNWNPVSGATGYKWNTVNDFASATDMGTATTKIETGLSCNTAYTRYVWAYNGCGYSSPVNLTQSTLACWICGVSTITINHVAGAVAPVTKTTTYGTVTNIPGESTKCWITSNLGSDHQATAVNDTSEASAGWYWQFNRKQGYKYGSTVTPSWTITSIDENSNWLAENDPCLIELGGGWRIPTNFEWSNLDLIGNWTNWNDTWNSGLKLHAAGYLNIENGSNYFRGTYGNYWSGVQCYNYTGWSLYFGNTFSTVQGGFSKAIGITIRCIKD